MAVEVLRCDTDSSTVNTGTPFRYGGGSKKTAFMTENIAALIAMPRARVPDASAKKPGARCNPRTDAENSKRKDLAIDNYKRPLELDPKNDNAVEMLKKLGVTWKPAK